MPCYHPLNAKRSPYVNVKTGKSPIVVVDFETDLKIPCGKCIGCRLEYSRQWALRITNEASLHSDNEFITLTYNDEYLPIHGTLVHADFQKFMKRFRKKVSPHKIRYYMCGEYGTDQDQPNGLGRPHYHAIIFNYRFEDQQLWKMQNSERIYRSKLLEQLWPYGYSCTGSVNFKTAAYVARYVMKKVNGEQADSHYLRLDERTGELYQVEPEYARMSRGRKEENQAGSGIGSNFFEKHNNQIKLDWIMENGVKMKPPKYYDSLFEKTDPEHYEKIKTARQEFAAADTNNTPSRLIVRESIIKQKTKQLERRLK